MSDANDLTTAVSRRVGAIRIGLGFAQGIALWLLTESLERKVWPATEPGLLGALAMAAMLAPFVVLGGISSLRPRTLAIWGVFAAAVLAGLGLHDLVRRGDALDSRWVSAELICFGAAGLFIAHHLIAGGDAERRFIARYPRYFDIAWKHGVQIVLSAGFVGVFWIVLLLGGALFNLIGIKFVSELIGKSWFFLPATATMFAAAVHLTDVRGSLIRGVRTVALTLLSWLLPVLVLLAAAFLAALPFTGLDPLWKTRSAASILLSAAAALIILINAAYQDGEPDGVVPPVLRLAGRVGGLLITPLIAIAIYALWLRISQHGLTPDRVVAGACALVGVVYAVGYAWAAVRPGRWMRRVEWTNIAAAFLTLALLLLIFSPLADPARLSVNDQMARLRDGKVSAEKFDYGFLRFDGERYGKAALETLKTRPGEVGRQARTAIALAETARWDRGGEFDRKVEARHLSVVHPKGAALPAGFLDQMTDEHERRVCAVDEDHCQAALLDLNGDGVDEIVVVGGITGWVHAQAGGRWSQAGELKLITPGIETRRVREALERGEIKAARPRLDDVEIGGVSYEVQRPPAQ